MPEDNGDKWSRLPKPNFNSKKISRHLRKAEGATVRHAHKFVIKRWNNIREVQRNVVTWVLIIGTIIAATGLQLSWNQLSYLAKAPVEDGVYAEAIVSKFETLNPLFASTAGEQSASRLLFSRLLSYDRTGSLGYDLANSVTTNDKKNTYTVTIRPDAKWHDGVKLTANDVVYTVNLMKDPNARAVDSGWSDVTVKALNETTLEFTLASTYAAFEHALTFAILPEHILGRIAPINIRESNFSNKPIGSGPFKLSFIQEVGKTESGNKVIYLARNDDYYGGQGKLARFQLHLYDSVDRVVSALSSSEVNAAVGLSASDLNGIDTKKFEIVTKPIQGGVFTLFNTQSQLLKNVNLRRALRLATDTESIRKELSNAIPKLELPLTNSHVSGPLPKAPNFNKTEAIKIFNNEGWKLNEQNVLEKKKSEFKLSVAVVKNSELERVVEVIAGQWRAIGIAVETKVIDLADTTHGDSQAILQYRDYDVLINQLNIGADPDVYAYWHSSQATVAGLNFSNYSNLISDDALLSARSRTEPKLRNAKYITFINQWLKDVPAIGIYQSTMQYVVNRNSRSFDKSNIIVSPIDRYADILDWSVGMHEVYKSP